MDQSSGIFSLVGAEPPTSSLVPYTTLFRSKDGAQHGLRRAVGAHEQLGVEDVRRQHLHVLHRPWLELAFPFDRRGREHVRDRKSTRLNSSHVAISYAVFCLKKKQRFNFVKT